ncbi:MAG TPA: ankyrin repeat domain-containing protein [Planctomycetota bacterium]|nr:ankyrin repeat domain-containing protein [Planctomycetota bacterium]
MVRRKAKKKTLPKDFKELLEKGNLAKLKATFETCDVNARGGYAKQSALAFDECPDELVRWLVSQGADLSAADTRGNTPLHSRAGSWRGSISVLLELGADVNAVNYSMDTPLHAAAERKNAEHAAQLLARGAKVDVRNKDGLTPLGLALRSLVNAELDQMPALVKVLLGAGASKTPSMKSYVERIGESFEFHRENFSSERLPEADAALQFLYRTFEVTPVPRRVRHDGKSIIVVKATTWQKQHAELCDLLVPARGSAETVQGEVIRISGNISGEWERNGGMNWDQAYAAMARAFAGYVERGTPLDESEVDEIKSIVRSLSKENGRGNARLGELAVAWVLRNPRPLPLETPSYKR